LKKEAKTFANWGTRCDKAYFWRADVFWVFFQKRTAFFTGLPAPIREVFSPHQRPRASSKGMSYWGKVVGGAAGLVMGGPLGMLLGAAAGHAADSGALPFSLRSGFLDPANFHPARMAALFTPREQLFALSVVSLAAKLAKCDAPVNRAEIDAFKRQFRIPPENLRNVGRLFDQARLSADDFEPYAAKLGEAFADNRGLLEDVLGGLFGIARADGAINDRELKFLSSTARAFALDRDAWDRARSGAARPSAAQASPSEPSAYDVLGVKPSATDDEIRAAWKKLMRDNHPDSLASRGVPPEFIARASDKVARINAAWDRVKRDRKL
jgi:DnaJ like chaperone protein